MIEETNPYRNTIKLNQEIVSVTKTDKYKFDVFTKNGSIYSAKHVLVIFSRGVLNARTIKCQPDLRVWKYEALVLAPMSYYSKLFLLFTERFWDTSNYFVTVAKRRGEFFGKNLVNYFGKKMVLSTLTRGTCKESHKKSDEKVKQEIYQILKNIYKNAMIPTGSLISLLQTIILTVFT